MPRPTGTLSRSLLALSVTLLMISPAYAPTWTVCSSGCDFTSILDAVDSAASGDALELGAETFVENVSIIEKDLQLRGAGPEHTVIDGAAAGTVIFLDLVGSQPSVCCGPRGCVRCEEPVFYSATVSGLTIRNGSSEFGGGIKQHSGQLALDDCVIEDNVADSGGGIWAAGGSDATLDIENSVIRHNIAETAGGIYNKLRAVITTTTISGNSGSPSAIYNYSGYSTLNLNRSTITGNTGPMTIQGSPTITSSTISGNSGVVIGPTVFARIHNSTITGNDIGISGVYRLTMNHSIVVGNRFADCTGAAYFYSDGHNLFDEPCEFSCGSIHPTDILNADPLLLPLAFNGGPTATHALHHDSPAIDSGGDECEATDQRGVALPQDGDNDGIALCDIGAFEFVPPTTLVAQLIEHVESLDLPHGIKINLLSKLNAASLILGDLQENNDNAAANALGAFIHQVQARYGRMIPPAVADALIEAAEDIIELLDQAESEVGRRVAAPRSFSPVGRHPGELRPQEPE